jgi:alkylation response protein AidB-like acyl-CoA dehydrogenase
MNFALTPEQIEMRDALRDMLRSVCPPSIVRRAWQAESNQAVVSELLRHLARMGVLGILAPAELGGLGGDEIDLAVLMEECGRFAVPGPLAEHAAVGVPALAAAAHPQAAAPAVGTTVVTALEPARGRVAFAQQSDLCILVADSSVTLPGEWRIGAELSLVDYSLRSALIEVRAREPLARFDATMAVNRAALAIAAQLLGLAEQVLHMTVGYVKSRTQFGVLIGSQQAVKHTLASALIALEHARPVVYRAAYALAHREPKSSRDVSFAKVYAYRAAHAAARSSLQCHGAIGYAWEHDLHLWMKRIWSLAPAWGTIAQHERRVADSILAPA